MYLILVLYTFICMNVEYIENKIFIKVAMVLVNRRRYVFTLN